MYGADTYDGGDNANDRETTFQITSTKLYIPVVTLSTKDNVNLTKQLNEGFKRSVYWNEYNSKLILLGCFFFKTSIDYLFLLLTILKMVIKRLTETVIENISHRE